MNKTILHGTLYTVVPFLTVFQGGLHDGITTTQFETLFVSALIASASALMGYLNTTAKDEADKKALLEQSSEAASPVQPLTAIPFPPTPEPKP